MKVQIYRKFGRIFLKINLFYFFLLLYISCPGERDFISKPLNISIIRINPRNFRLYYFLFHINLSYFVLNLFFNIVKL